MYMRAGISAPTDKVTARSACGSGRNMPRRADYMHTRDPWEARPASACAGRTVASGTAAMRERAAAGATGRAPARPTARRSPRIQGGTAAGCRRGAQSVDTSSWPRHWKQQTARRVSARAYAARVRGVRCLRRLPCCTSKPDNATA
jgi:hypothetical protein